MLRISWLFCIFRYSPANKVWNPKRGKFPNKDMAKIQNISEIHPTLGFTEFDIIEKYRKSFHESELGRLHSVFPFERMAKTMGLSEQRLGRRNIFSPSAKIALMVLKAYTGFSDRQLVEHLNGNIHYQMFCGIMINPSFPITNYKIVSAIRNEIASRLDVDSLQEVLASHWKPYLDSLHICMADATCYESHMRYPTDMKLLWESLEWLYRYICRHCVEPGIRRPRNKYRNVAESYLSYCKKRKRKASRTKMLRRRMIRLLEKLLIQRDEIHREYGTLLRYTQDYQKRLSIIRKVLVQEKEMFVGKKVRDRIVSIDRHYVRPIVRGKETKSVEFGAKVNNIQIDGISFIEHLSFKAFNEGIRLKDCIRMQQKLMNVRVRCVAADSIYANNAKDVYKRQHLDYYQQHNRSILPCLVKNILITLM